VQATWRRQVLAASGGRCVVCGGREGIEGHHLEALEDGGRWDGPGVALCPACHREPFWIRAPQSKQGLITSPPGVRPTWRARCVPIASQLRRRGAPLCARVRGGNRSAMRVCAAYASQRGPLVVVGATGFEPATARPPAECATRLRYAPWVSEG
jgi:hypothetical protein